MAGLTPAHLILILVIALLVIGPGKLPETGAALGRAMREFRNAVDGKSDASPVPPAAPAPGSTPASSSPDAANESDSGPTA